MVPGPYSSPAALCVLLNLIKVRKATQHSIPASLPPAAAALDRKNRVALAGALVVEVFIYVPAMIIGVRVCGDQNESMLINWLGGLKMMAAHAQPTPNQPTNILQKETKQTRTHAPLDDLLHGAVLGQAQLPRPARVHDAGHGVHDARGLWAWVCPERAPSIDHTKPSGPHTLNAIDPTTPKHKPHTPCLVRT